MTSYTKVRGSTIHIGTTATTASSDTYTEVKGCKAYQGDIGIEYGEIDVTTIPDEVKQSGKGIADAGDLTLGGIYDHADAGQQALKTAGEASDDSVYNFKIVQPNGRIRYIKARAMGFRLSYGTNADVIQYKSKLSLTAVPTEVAA